MKWLSLWKQTARKLKTQTIMLYFAYREPRTPWYAKVVSVVVLAYAFSPIDLIPDFIPVLGYLDDLILIPMGVYLAVKLIPQQIMDEARIKTEMQLQEDIPEYRLVGLLIICLWIIAALLAVRWGYQMFQR